ncbi:hypothetical protein M3P05_13160 [Sansalvadorimonas sp. 2012CJ34-2]|uniref:Uncharacterized protein n=1 Tax=Parendozoicomonas callyspongiae TaxID=2942213 RepID=A0ABT0PHM1_9GAMM|nr:hypothetical protein [Sansalvadorimonas sp. 2012CJ34-2]MCL6270873.1 hypothetical protein [Sansalvadorimonas sp. 2012CJ34-2]
MQNQSLVPINGLNFSVLGSLGSSVASEVQPLLHSALGTYVQVVEAVKYFFYEYVCPFFATLLSDRDIKAVEPAAPYMSQAKFPDKAASEQHVQKSLISTLGSEVSKSSDCMMTEVEKEPLSKAPVSRLVIDTDDADTRDLTDEVDIQDPEMAIKPGTPGFQKLVESYIPEIEEEAVSLEEDDSPSVPQITVTDESTDTADTGVELVTEQSPSLELSITPQQSLIALSAALFSALPEHVRESIRSQELTPQEDKSEDDELRAMQMAEKSLQTFGVNVNKGVQGLYADLFQFGKTIESEDLLTPRTAFTKKSGAELSQITERHQDVKLAWEAFKDAAVNVLEVVDTCTDNPLGYSKLKHRAEKAEDLQADALKWGSNFSRLATDHKKIRPLLRQTVGRHAVSRTRKYRDYRDAKVTPMTDALDEAVQEWLDNSPYWQRVLANFSVFERIMKEKVPSFEISNAAVITQLLVWIRGRLLDRAKEETLPPMRAETVTTKLKRVFTGKKKSPFVT